nr:ATP-binding protein [uncultured Blautia sp.]
MLKNSGEIKWTISERKNKIKFQTVFLGILFLLFLFLTAAGVGVWKKYRDRLMENQFEQLQISARSLAGSMETSMKEYIWDFHILESIQDHETATPWEDTQKYSAYLNEGNSFVEDVFWINKDGEFLGSISGKKFQNPVFLTESKEGIYFLQMEDEKGKRYIVLKEKLFTEKQFCIAVDEEEYYQKLISRIRVGENGYVVVKNSDGKIIMHPEDEQWGIDVIEGRKELYPNLDLSSLERMVEEQKSGREGISQYYSYWWTDPELPRVYKVSAYAPVDLGGDFWVVSAVMDYDEFYEPIRDGFINICLIASGIFLLVFLLFVFLGKMSSDRKKSEGEIKYLKELNALLEEVHQGEEKIAHQQRLQIMGTMTGGIAHEFNNFLTPIMGYAEILMMELPPDSEQYDSACEIYEASEKAKEVVRQISSLSRKNVETVYRLMPAQKLFTRAVKMVESICPVHVKLTADIQAGEAKILGNATQINQVILNICVNAVHAIGKKEGMLEIKVRLCRRQELPGHVAERFLDLWKEYLTITITDNGCGMDKEVLKHIFDPFFTTKKGGEGTGLGLALAEQIILSHKGCIYAESQQGKGSCFRIYLPVTEAETEIVSGQEEKHYRIIVADDNAKVLQMLEKNFSRLGIEIKTCMRVDTLKQCLEEQEADVLFIDERLADGSGVEFCMAAAGKYPGMLKIIMADYMTRELAEAKKRGIIDNCVEKPVSDTVLLEAIRQCLDI